MTIPPFGSERPFIAQLRLSSPEAQAKARDDEAKRAAYRRAYWQKYNKRVRRVYGTLKPDDYVAVAAVAAGNGRTVWGQIWAESCAYRSGTLIPTTEIATGQQALIAELRKVGNNLNQLARLGHIQAGKDGQLTPPADDRIGAEVRRQMDRLEAAVTRFSA